MTCVYLTSAACMSVQAIGWLAGTISGSIFAVGLMLAIASTPRLRERAITLATGGFVARWMPVVWPVLCLGIWIGGAWLAGATLLRSYAIYSAAAATLILSVIILPIIATAASQIAQRSVW